MRLRKREWREVAMRYGSPSHHYYVGDILFGVVSYNSFKSKGVKDRDYAYRFTLPGITNTQGATPTIGYAKLTIERLTDQWLSKVLV